MGTKYMPQYREFAEEQLQTSSGDLTEIEGPQIDNILLRAVARYNQDRPRVLVEQIEAATGNSAFRFDLPSGWVPGFSSVIDVELPVGEQIQRFLRRQEYRVVYAIGDGGTTVQKLHFPHRIPQEPFAVYYTAPHAVTETSSTIEDGDFTAVGYLFCNHLCIALAGRLRRTRDSARSTDMIDLRKSKAAEYNDQAKMFFDLYRHLMGLPDKGMRPALTIRDYDPLPSWGRDYLTHRS